MSETIPIWMQVLGGFGIALLILDRVFAFLVPILSRKNGNGHGPCSKIESAYFRGRKVEQVILEENAKDMAIAKMATDIAELTREQKRTRRLVQADLARDIGCNVNDLNPDETGVGMPAIDSKK